MYFRCEASVAIWEYSQLVKGVSVYFFQKIAWTRSRASFKVSAKDKIEKDFSDYLGIEEQI
jgi:hypothetical protein